MKNLLLLLISALVLVSCLDEEEVNPSFVAYGLVISPYAEGELDYAIALDNGQFVLPYMDLSDSPYEVEDNERILVYLEYDSYNSYYSDTTDVKILDHVTIPGYDILTYTDSIGADTLGNDPIAVANGSIYLTKNYLNIIYSYNEGYTPKSHSINLVYYPDSTDEDGRILLKLHHNANNDLEQEYYSGFKVFDLNSVAPFAEVSDSLLYRIDVNAGDYDPSYAADYFLGVYYEQ